MSLSPESRFQRLMYTLREPSAEFVARLVNIDQHRDMALVAVQGEGAAEKIIGVARYAADPDGRDCEFAVAVADEWQCRGIGTTLIKLLFEHAAAKAFARFMAPCSRTTSACSILRNGWASPWRSRSRARRPCAHRCASTTRAPARVVRESDEARTGRFSRCLPRTAIRYAPGSRKARALAENRGAQCAANGDAAAPDAGHRRRRTSAASGIHSAGPRGAARRVVHFPRPQVRGMTHTAS